MKYCNHPSTEQVKVIVDDEGTLDTACLVCLRELVAQGICEESHIAAMRIVEVTTTAERLEDG